MTYACTCDTPVTSGRAHAPDCPITPLRDAALRRAAEAVRAWMNVRPAKKPA